MFSNLWVERKKRQHVSVLICNINLRPCLWRKYQEKMKSLKKKKKCLQLTPQPFILRATAPPAEPRQNGGIIVEYKRASVYSLYFLKASAVELHTHHLNRCSSSFFFFSIYVAVLFFSSSHHLLSFCAPCQCSEMARSKRADCVRLRH